MLRNLLTIFPILLAILLCSCEDYNEIDDQRTDIVDYLDDLGVEYETLGNVYRYKVEVEEDEEELDEDTVVASAVKSDSTEEAEYISKGSKFYIYFAGYTFSSGPSSLFFTNVEDIALEYFEDLNTEYWSFEPLEITLGQTDIIKGLETGLEGLQYGDVVNIIMSSDQAYGDKGVGVVPANTAVMYTVQILD